MDSGSLFTTGIENSYPTLPTGRRIDQMDKCGHFMRWEEDFALLSFIGGNALRFGPAYYLTHPAPDRFDWSSADAPMHCLRNLGVTVIGDLCHFGVPEWLGGFHEGIGFRSRARAYVDRYRIPLFHCENNRVSDHAVEWLGRQWDDVTNLVERGVPVRGFTWYSLTDQDRLSARALARAKPPAPGGTVRSQATDSPGRRGISAHDCGASPSHERRASSAADGHRCVVTARD